MDFAVEATSNITDENTLRMVKAQINQMTSCRSNVSSRTRIASYKLEQLGKTAKECTCPAYRIHLSYGLKLPFPYLLFDNQSIRLLI